jgi:hypothetical protein
MMLVIYGVLAWSMIGFIAAVLMGRAMAICAGAERDEAGLARSLRPLRTQPAKSLETRKVA